MPVPAEPRNGFRGPVFLHPGRARDRGPRRRGQVGNTDGGMKGLMVFREKPGWQGEYSLKGEEIEEMAARMEDYLRAVHTEHTDVLRIRFSLEEALLRWRDRFGEGERVRVSAIERLGKPTITMELTGDPYDPLTSAENDLGEWADSLLDGIGLNPVYSYRKNTNTVQLQLKRKQLHPAAALLIAVGIGLVFGLLGDLLLPEGAKNAVVTTVYVPVRTAFLRILNTAGGPIIFFSVLAAVCGVGNAAAMSRQGRRLILRFLVSISLMTVATAAVTLLVLRPAAGDAGQGGANGIFDFFMRIIPTDIFTPMISGDSPQLILIALVLGHAFLSVGQQSGGLVGLVDQLNTAGLLIADWVGRVTPFFVSLLLIFGIWYGSLAPLLALWKPALLFCVLCGGIFLAQMLAVSGKEKISPRALLRKMKDSFLAAVRTGSVNSAYGANQLCCENRLGIAPGLTKAGLPLGLLIYMPAGTVACMIVILHETAVNGVPISPFWLLMAVLLTVTLQVASPPVTGIGLLTYAVIFTQLGIPEDALTTAMILDILFGFITTPLNQAMLQLELVLEADRSGVLDRAVLER